MRTLRLLSTTLTAVGYLWVSWGLGAAVIRGNPVPVLLALTAAVAVYLLGATIAFVKMQVKAAGTGAVLRFPPR